ncbi:hypothetical protein [Flavobacterium sp.]|uniref:hypothetical protein n=1 Tax=Flavobacterium sp. TaxID=239 RepID=UPI0026064DD7|nr:hypothetical protein [Flavobacterium sp.]
MKLTPEQITEIDRALGKIGIAYLDIRCELTDHVATQLEAEGGDFETELARYIKENKKSLRRTNRKMFFATSAGAYAEVFKTLARPGFLILFIAFFGLMQLLLQFMAAENVGRIGFFIFCIVSSYLSFRFLIRTFYTRRSYSGAVGFSIFSLAILYITLYAGGWLAATGDIAVSLYYALINTVTLAMIATSEKQYKLYKSRYV